LELTQKEVQWVKDGTVPFSNTATKYVEGRKTPVGRKKDHKLYTNKHKGL